MYGNTIFIMKIFTIINTVFSFISEVLGNEKNGLPSINRDISIFIYTNISTKTR